MSSRKYGWKAPPPHKRGDMYMLPVKRRYSLAVPSVDLRCFCPPVYDQAALGSCTANAICADHQFCQIKEHASVQFTPSRLFVYYNERQMEGTVGEDVGACIHDGISSLNTLGVCPETMWPYNITQFATQPSAACYTTALGHKSQTYISLRQDLDNLKACLANGFGFVFGITVYESFESLAVAKTGIVPMPDTTKEQVLGGHAIMCVGYDDTKSAFLVRNSWGSTWGQGGYCWIPYAYMTNDTLASDFWCVSQVLV